MNKTELEYANELIEKYNKIFCDNYKNQGEIVECAIQDVENTIEALSRQYTEIWGKGKDWKFTEEHDYYQKVLQILKDKL